MILVNEVMALSLTAFRLYFCPVFSYAARHDHEAREDLSMTYLSAQRQGTLESGGSGSSTIFSSSDVVLAYTSSVQEATQKKISGEGQGEQALQCNVSVESELEEKWVQSEDIYHFGAESEAI
ncbi:hypothetical protein B0H15DRAFT_796151 [Mycena belliarum]|uniref:Uncharacterized protein n=1 Tax=Mycena belliarum TaxID=1033014 RepID=A0AAD6UG13_9AGAR|nr:hypothetical protein B0H15DRAFT_796151 [Mycena belliae]